MEWNPDYPSSTRKSDEGAEKPSYPTSAIDWEAGAVTHGPDDPHEESPPIIPRGCIEWEGGGIGDDD